MTEKSAATLTIHRASEMSVEGRKDIADWLRKQAVWFEQDGGNYSKRFTARFLYETDKEEKENAK